MRSIEVTYSDGQKIQTSINGTDDEIRRYYLGKSFNLGRGAEDYVVKATDVKFLDEDPVDELLTDPALDDEADTGRPVNLKRRHESVDNWEAGGPGGTDEATWKKLQKRTERDIAKGRHPHNLIKGLRNQSVKHMNLADWHAGKAKRGLTFTDKVNPAEADRHGRISRAYLSHMLRLDKQHKLGYTRESYEMMASPADFAAPKAAAASEAPKRTWKYLGVTSVSGDKGEYAGVSNSWQSSDGKFLAVFCANDECRVVLNGRHLFTGHEREARIYLRDKFGINAARFVESAAG